MISAPGKTVSIAEQVSPWSYGPNVAKEASTVAEMYNLGGLLVSNAAETAASKPANMYNSLLLMPSESLNHDSGVSANPSALRDLPDLASASSSGSNASSLSSPREDLPPPGSIKDALTEPSNFETHTEASRPQPSFQSAFRTEDRGIREEGPIATLPQTLLSAISE